MKIWGSRRLFWRQFYWSCLHFAPAIQLVAREKTRGHRRRQSKLRPLKTVRAPSRKWQRGKNIQTIIELWLLLLTRRKKCDKMLSRESCFGRAPKERIQIWKRRMRSPRSRCSRSSQTIASRFRPPQMTARATTMHPCPILGVNKAPTHTVEKTFLPILSDKVFFYRFVQKTDKNLLISTNNML